MLGSAAAQRGLQQARETAASFLETAEEDSETVRRDIPHEPGCWMRFRRLTTPELEEAKAEGRRESRIYLADIGVAEPASNLRTPPLRSLDGYDKDVLIHHGIVAWCYDEPVNEANIDKLPAGTYEWAARQVLDLSVPKHRKRTGAGGRLPLHSLDADQARIARSAKGARGEGRTWKETKRMSGGYDTKTLKKYIRMLDDGAVDKD